ncbi:MAG: CPBP family glutamic-type intramembrane protease, partial [Pirellulaceae bacterium]|nr:CPBP family glutamic-type intramembrane protease [Pirellulaceae bacterium]
IDLCAGEKERGTLETLLSSPAQRQEIVWGKLLTVITFSISTAVLNLLSMGITGTFVMKQLALGGGLPNLGMPPVSALFWLGLVLIPISALFSALALAIASFARSSKEGQYYLMPLLMGTLPLMMLPMMPAVELNLGMSLIPISGVLLLLKNLIEGEFQQALIYCLPVIGVTGVCCWIAIRWATNQFQNEEVLFSGSERFSVGVWLKHLIRDRGATPGFSEALMCAMAILLIRFFANAFMAGSSQTIDFSNIVSTTLTIQLAFILTPALIMTVFLTTNYRKTLSLKIPKLRFAIGMFALAVFMHPATFLLNMGIQALYPIDVGKLPVLVELVKEFQSKDIITLILLIGVTPAICEELAFRGFIFSGFRHSGRKWVAIVLSAFFFGATHGILQQSISAAVLGCLLGAIVIKTGSIFPAMIYHCTHNSLSVFFLKMPQWFDQEGILPYFVSEQTQETFTGDFMVGYIYNTPVMVLFTIAAFAILLWLYLQPSANTEEEQLHEKISHQND